ncbi:MAG: sigma-70 family RNA polymerase sigma factor [Phycisphaerales bacterium]
MTSRTPLSNLQRRRGVNVGTDRSGGAPSRGLRALNEHDRRLISEILANEQDYIDSEEFRKPDAERAIYDEAPDIRKPDASWYSPVMNDLGITKTRLPRSSDQVILTGAEERVIFLQYNYARFRVAELRDEILESPDRTPTEEQAHDLLRWYRKSRVLREQIAETNLALVLAMAKRTRMSEVDFADLVSEGNMALLRAVDKFDAGRGFKFSTYACRAIIKAFSRQGMKLSKYRQRFPTDFDPKLERSNFVESKREEFLTDSASEVKRIVVENRADLSDIEKTVIEHRFRLEDEFASHSKPMTLEQVGQIIGVTKERVRQIQNKALEKIRIELEESFIEGKPRKGLGRAEAVLN